ncbi:MAG: hypothetical protein ACYSWU_24475 [Planctomycetota bacterium]
MAGVIRFEQPGFAPRLEFHLCGSYVARVRRVDNSARANHGKYIRQGTRMIDRLREDKFATGRLGDRLDWPQLA